MVKAIAKLIALQNIHAGIIALNTSKVIVKNGDFGFIQSITQEGFRGEFSHLFPELLCDEAKFRGYFRMSTTLFFNSITNLKMGKSYF